MLSKLIKYMLAVIVILLGGMWLLSICLTIGISMQSSSYTKGQIERLFDIYIYTCIQVRLAL